MDYCKIERSWIHYFTSAWTSCPLALTNECMIGDLDGDGKTDFWCMSGWWLWAANISNGNGWVTNNWSGQPDGPVGTLCLEGDLNGDGKTDMWCDAGNGTWNIYMSTGSSWTTGVWNGPAPAMPVINQCLTGDLNGDGKTDMWCYLGNGVWDVAISTGSGWIRGFWNGPAPAIPVGNQCMTGDLNGDGKTDMWCYLGNGVWDAAISTGSGWTRGFWNGPVTAIPITNLCLTGDLNGDGKTDMWCETGSGTGLWSVASSGGDIADRLKIISNSLGNVTTFSYVSSSNFDNQGHLPYSVPVVSSISVNDGLGNVSTTSYTYSGGYYDIPTKEFRGFASVMQTNPDGTTLTTRFHQRTYYNSSTDWDDADYKGKPRQTIFNAPDSTPLSQTDFIWDKSILNGSVFAKLAEKSLTSIIGGAAPIITYEKNDYDGMGNRHIQMTADISPCTIDTYKKFTCIPSTTNAESVTTTNEYANLGSSARAIERLTSTTVTGSSNPQAIVRQTTYTYYPDGSGNQHTKTFYNDSGPSPLITMEYDSTGNLTSSTDGRSNKMTTIYDATKTYPVEVDYPDTTTTAPDGVIHTVHHVVQYQYDYRYGAVRYAWDENSNMSENVFDAFGRSTQKISYVAGGPGVAAKTKTEYQDTGVPRYTKTSVLESNSTGERYIDRYDYADGLGRNIQTITFGEGNKSVVSQIFYDLMGRTALIEGPFFGTGIGYPIQTPVQFPWTQTQYDYFGHPSLIQRGDGNYGIVESYIYYSGLSTTVVDPDDSAKTEKKDYLGRTIQVTEVNGNLDMSLNFGMSGDSPISGTWSASSGTKANIGIFRNGVWALDINGDATWEVAADSTFIFGMAGDVPVVGDWKGDGKTETGVFRNGAWYLDYVGDGFWRGCGAPADPTKDICFNLGMAGDVPAVGDWSGNGKTKIGVFRNGAWYLDYVGDGVWHGCGAPTDPTKDICFNLGLAGDIPVVGDWSGNGKTKIGVFRNGAWFLDYVGDGVWHGCGAPADPTKDLCFNFGMAGDIPVVGDWNGDGITKIGVFRSGGWYLDFSGDGTWNPTGIAPAQAGNDKPIGLYNTTYTYNAAGNLMTVKDTKGSVTTIHYDTLGRKKDMTDPDMGSWQYTYDLNGNLETQTDAQGQLIRFAYDELNRVTTKSYEHSLHPDADSPVAYLYDNLLIPNANGRGNLYSVSNTQVTTTYNSYDAMGRAISVTESIAGLSPLNPTLTEYDLSGKPTKVTYPDNYYVTNSYYPGTTLIQSVTGSDGKVYATNSLYEPTGKIRQINYGNGTAAKYSYDAWSTKLLGISATTPQSTSDPRTQIINRVYQYSPAGDILGITDFKKGAEIGLANNAFQYQYTYDTLHRLMGETTTGGTYQPLTMTYDETGNILTKNTGSASLTYQYNDTAHKHAVSRIIANGTTRDFGYDANGNMTGGWDVTNANNPVQRTIVYNADNKPYSITYGSATSTFVYDGSGGRAIKVSPSGTTYYVGKHSRLSKRNSAATKYIFGKHAGRKGFNSGHILITTEIIWAAW